MTIRDDLITKVVTLILRGSPGAAHARLVADTERVLLREALTKCGGNQAHAAALLGLNRNTIHKKVALYKLSHLIKGHFGGWPRK